MKCIIGFVVVVALHLARAGPVRNGMVYYQSQPYTNYYNPMANRAFLMQYASRPVRRQAVSAFASGKKISAGTYLKESESLEDEDQEQTQYYEKNDRRVQSVAEAYPAEEEETAPEIEVYRKPSKPVKASIPLPENYPQEDVPTETPEHVQTPLTLQRKKKIPVQEAEDDDEEEEEYKPRKGSKQQNPINTYFPVHFGSNAGAAIAVANAYSTGKGGQAASRATAYGSPANSRKRTTL